MLILSKLEMFVQLSMYMRGKHCENEFLTDDGINFTHLFLDCYLYSRCKDFIKYNGSTLNFDVPLRSFRYSWEYFWYIIG